MRKHKARGMCKICYEMWRRSGADGSVPRASCHPEKPSVARGLCRACYDTQWQKAFRHANPLICRTCRVQASRPGSVICLRCAQLSRNQAQRIRAQVFAAYGGAHCACCSEATPEFLSIDHIAGRVEPTEKLTGIRLYYWLKRNGYPFGFQVLCHNCNMAKGLYGQCPHENAKGKTRVERSDVVERTI